jgi:cytochrome c oxidase accessory protein FixG
LGIYYITPWIRWDRGEFAPDQAVLVDLFHRRFYFFWIEIWPQEFYYVAGMLVMAAIGLFLVTSSVGRAWCGYTCPQTVWVDLFLVVERFVEGDRNRRIRLDKEPTSVSKLTKRVVKHGMWLLIAVATGGAWIFYFADAPSLLANVIDGTAPSVAYGTIAVLTFTTYSLGGLMREQVCTYMCPWPRIQAAMLDEYSLTVTYNAWRGEPRGRHTKQQDAAGAVAGDCVDCNACVAVCPMGIDIRDGQQLECITCALCIDACDAVMEKLDRPKGLISYSNVAAYAHNMSLATADDGTIDPARTHTPGGGIKPEVQTTTLRSILRPRTMIYFAIWGLIGLTMVAMVSTRGRLELNVLHDRNPVSVTLSDGSVRNGYTVKILNMMPEKRTIMITIEDFPGATMTVPLEKDSPRQALFLDVEPDQLHTQRLFVTADPDALEGQQTPFRFWVRDSAGSERAEYDAMFDNGGSR